MNGIESLQPQMNRIQRYALAFGIISMAACVIGGFFNTRQFFHSYLIGFVFWLGITIGSAAILMLHHLVGGGWGYILRRILESATRTLPLMVLLVIPLFFGLTHLYSWTQAPPVQAASLLHFRSTYLRIPFFVIRTAIYFLIWLILVYFLNRWSAEQDRSHEPAEWLRRLRKFSGPCLIIYCLTATFAAVDWLMSLVPTWYSTTYGLLFIVSEVLSALAFVVAVALFLARTEPISSALTRQRMLDLGNLILAFIMLWAYLAFTQFLIIWAGNLPEEIIWYRTHIRGGWIAVVIALLFIHFAVPFFLLLFRFVKSKVRTLAAVAIGMLSARLVDVWWIVEPSLHPRIYLHWMDVLAAIGIGGLWLSVFLRQLKRRPILPLQPALEGLAVVNQVSPGISGVSEAL